MLQLPQHINALFELFQDEPLYLVGGAIRNLSLGKACHDYDFATSASVAQMETILADYTLDLHAQSYGNIRFFIGSDEIAITTFRVEADYVHHRSPSKLQFVKSVAQDALRRDFTINAIYYNKSYYDPFDGRTDLTNKCIRCIGDPWQRFDEDALRMLRAIRFAMQLDFQIEKNTQEALSALLELTLKLSPQTIRKEVEKIACCENYRLLAQSGWITMLFGTTRYQEHKKTSDDLVANLARLLISFDLPLDALTRLGFGKRIQKQVNHYIM
ncbi:MAG: hypothetical protein ACRCZJ_01335 [Erysipelotrichaceae bacterium]